MAYVDKTWPLSFDIVDYINVHDTVKYCEIRAFHNGWLLITKEFATGCAVGTDDARLGECTKIFTYMAKNAKIGAI